MKCQILFSRKNKNILKCRLLKLLPSSKVLIGKSLPRDLQQSAVRRATDCVKWRPAYRSILQAGKEGSDQTVRTT